jgi:hypothetical protein
MAAIVGNSPGDVQQSACSFVPSLPPAPVSFCLRGLGCSRRAAGDPNLADAHLHACARRQHHDGAALPCGQQHHADRVTSQSQSQRPHVSRTLPPAAAHRSGLAATRCLILALHSSPCLHSRGSSCRPPNGCRATCQCAPFAAGGRRAQLDTAPSSTSVLGPSSDAAPWRMQSSAGLLRRLSGRPHRAICAGQGRHLPGIHRTEARQPVDGPTE